MSTQRRFELGCVLIKSALGVGASDVCFSPTAAQTGHRWTSPVGQEQPQSSFVLSSEDEPSLGALEYQFEDQTA